MTRLGIFLSNSFVYTFVFYSELGATLKAFYPAHTMSASRRAQVQALCGVRSGPLIDRVESYMAAVDVWSRRGNAKAVKSAGTGVIAVCCLLAAER